jgi:2-keto-4-pentenoate hydratase/2-oxohepta-3-ene-1,7-dioic acid hydratase in catechol pathway
MRFVRFTSVAYQQGVYGLLGDDGNIEIITRGLLEPVERTGESLNVSQILRYLSPVDPPNVFAIGLNYRNHADETSDSLPKAPLMFIKATTAVSAHEDNIILPIVAPNQVDYEAELAVIIGRKARNVKVDEALDYVIGYTCANDVSSRDCQMRDGQWARGKSFDTFAPLGPYVVTDVDPGNLQVQMRLNGEVMQNQSTSDLVFDVATLVSYLSHSLTLLPNTVILTGTPGGVGFTRKPPIFLRAGDVCEVDIEGIGILRNKVAVS